MYPLIRRYLRRVDVVYLLLCAACSAISIAVLVSIGQTQLGSNNKASVQLIASLLGLMLAAVFSTADYHALARAWPLHGVVAWGLVLPTLFLHNVNTGLVTIGYDAGGTSNYSWCRVGGMTFQPAELAKISFILTLALHLSQVRGQVNRPKNLLLLFVHIALPAAAIHVQGDDGTALVFLGIGLVMLYAGGLSHWLVAGGLTAGVVGGAALLTLRPGILKGYQFKRILAVLTPDDPALADITYQQNKGAMAIGTGGLTGQGLLSGEHIFVPNAWNDFIFAYLANVLGFLGAAAVLLLLFALCLRTLRTGLQCPDALGCNICVGIFAALFLQCVINIGMNLQVLPVIGVTLPFFSAGGSSVVMVYLCVGLVLAVSRKNRRKKLAVPIELEQLVLSFNHMIERIEDVFTRQSNFSADIAHEIRTPITNLITQTEIALSQTRSQKELEDVLYSSLEEFSRMSRMVSDMLFLAQADNNQLIPEQKTLNLADEVNKVFDFFEAWAEEKEVTLRFTGNGCWVNGDPLMLRRAISNLLSNAIRYTPGQQAVTIQVSESAGQAKLVVENPGAPIAPEHLPRLFDRFYRVDPSRQRKGEGSGIGLAIVKSIVTAHHGSVVVESDSRSTRFILTLPKQMP